MTRSLSLGCALASVFALASACSSGEPGDPSAVAGMSGSAGAGTQAGTSSGGTSAGNTSASGSAAGGTATTTAGSASGGSAGQATAGSGGASGGTAGGGGGSGGAGLTPYNGPFTCSMYIGAYLSMEWWNAGFEEGVDGDKWQLKWHHHGHITEWAKPDSPFWADTGNPNDDSQGSPIQSACKTNSTAPDRIVFLAITWALTTQEAWVKDLKASVANIKAKYPSVKRVDLMTMIRCPNNMQCNPNQMYGVADSDTNAQHQDCQVPKYADDAIAQVIAEDPGYVALGPQFEMTMCNPSHDGAHMTGADNGITADKIAAFYAAKP